MILECPACHARYIVQIGLFAQGGRQVRCARCRHEWHYKLPTRIDVVMPPTGTDDPVPNAAHTPAGHGASETSGPPMPPPRNLPAVIRPPQWERLGRLCGIALAVIVAVLVLAILFRAPLARLSPVFQPLYALPGFDTDASGRGLEFRAVESEIRYDGGTMHLYVDGIIHNATDETKLVPDITAHALAPDRHVIQSWWVAAPQDKLAPGAEASLHTEINAPLNETIESVKLEFNDQESHGDAAR